MSNNCSPCHKAYKKNVKKEQGTIEGTTEISCNTPPLTTSKRVEITTSVEIQKHNGTTQVTIAIEHKCNMQNKRAS